MSSKGTRSKIFATIPSTLFRLFPVLDMLLYKLCKFPFFFCNFFVFMLLMYLKLCSCVNVVQNIITHCVPVTMKHKRCTVVCCYCFEIFPCASFLNVHFQIDLIRLFKIASWIHTRENVIVF